MFSISRVFGKIVLNVNVSHGKGLGTPAYLLMGREIKKKYVLWVELKQILLLKVDCSKLSIA